MAILDVEIIDESGHHCAARMQGVVPQNVDACKLGACLVHCYGVVFGGLQVRVLCHIISCSTQTQSHP